MTGTNRIHWIGSQPEAGEVMIPMLRTGEEQWILGKVALRLFGAFSEVKKMAAEIFATQGGR